MSIYENGSSVESVVGASRLLAQPLFDRVASGQTPPDDRTAGSPSPQSSASATGRAYDASRFGSRTASEEPFVYYHPARPHLSLDKDAPAGPPIEPPERGPVIPIPEVGGLHHRYLRRAA